MSLLLFLFLSLIGFSLGTFVACGASALLIGLGIPPRYAALTKTAGKKLWYEDCCMLGILLGAVLQLFPVALPFGRFSLAVLGVFFGIFLGSWIIALGEVINVYAILMRRLGITKGIALLIVVLAVGKTLGTLLYFANV